MACLICGSLAFDTILRFRGRFKDSILPERIHILNVSFLATQMRREFGGCAGNIAYNLKALGGEPVIHAALGKDGGAYLGQLQHCGIDAKSLYQTQDAFTAQASIITDDDNNQITAFHPGAMALAHRAHVRETLAARANPSAGASHDPSAGASHDIRLAIVAPDGYEAMKQNAEELAAAAIPFVFDPGQGLPMFSAQDLHRFLSLASWVALNDYEAEMLSQKIGASIATLSQRLQGAIVTKGEAGAEIWQRGQCQTLAAIKPEKLEDPTGCGDAFRAGLLFGLERGWSLNDSAALGNRLGSIKIASQGGQNHRIDPQALGISRPG